MSPRFALLLAMGLCACDFGGRFELPESPFNYANPDLPAHFLEGNLGVETSSFAPIRDWSPVENPVTDHGATLGRVLFFDPLLSRNETVACASCHVPELGFSDDRALSLGFEDGETGRHSMGLSNARYGGNGRYFWDERAATLEEQVLMPIQDDVEMGMTLEELVARVGAAPDYAPLFVRAFGDDEVTEERISRALAQFVRSILSYTSPYDEGRAQVSDALAPFPNFTDVENEGKRLFLEPLARGGFACFACHTSEAFAAPSATSNGLDLETTDRGLGGANERAEDDGRFRVPSLRNIAVRPPYMHDGRLADLDEVLDHYSEVKAHPALTVYNDADENVVHLDFTPDEHAALKAFLETLTDPDMLADPKYQDPFQ
jgi:cytochrome c peroxidase